MCRSLHKTSIILDAMRTGRDWPVMSRNRKLEIHMDGLRVNRAPTSPQCTASHRGANSVSQVKARVSRLKPLWSLVLATEMKFAVANPHCSELRVIKRNFNEPFWLSAGRLVLVDFRG